MFKGFLSGCGEVDGGVRGDLFREGFIGGF